MTEQPRTRLTNVIHSPTRLAILGALRSVDRTDFGDLRDSLELADSDLSRQLRILEEERLIEIAKFRVKRKPVTRVRLSESGRRRFEDYLAELRKVVNSSV
ncbi:transcriptional regulator [Salininema proteolyticum]|uniref:Transcriptional regulator n=1 Tax=Salininema proteolyticum TaxID=1607685 RepID=A0ABV8U4V4_9ACTN